MSENRSVSSVNLNPSMIKDRAANPAVFSRAQSFYNSGGKIQYYITYDSVDFYQIFGEVTEDEERHQVLINLDEKSQFIHHQCDCGTFTAKFGSCKHVIATLLKVYDDQIHNKLVIHSSADEEEGLIDELLSAYEANLTTDFNYEMYTKDVVLYPKLVVKSLDEIHLEVSIGHQRPYVVRDIYKLASDIWNENVVSYGKELQFKHSIQHFDEQSRPLAQFICEIVKEYDIYAKQLPTLGPIKSTRSIILTPAWLDKFYDLYKRETISCELEGLMSEHAILYPYEPKLEFRLTQQKNDYYFSHNMGPFKLVDGQKYTYIICEREAYRCGASFIKPLLPILKTMIQSPHFELKLNEAEMGKFLSLVMPKIKSYVRDVSLDALYEKFKVYPLTIKFYLDSLKRGNIGLKIQFCYGDTVIEANDPHSFEQNTTILRDANKEAKTLAMIEQYLFEKSKDGSYVLSDEDGIYSFIHEGVHELKQLGDVYASDTFKAIKIKEPQSFSVGIHLKNDWLSVNFEDLEFGASEYKKILASYRQNKKYFRLKDGSFLHLKNQYVDTLASFVDDLNLNDSDLDEDEILIPKYRALYLDQLTTMSQSLDVKRGDSFNEMIDEFKHVDEADYNVPNELESILRDYQKTGYRWLKTLAKYQMGGILADDMGLGKTIQVISVLLSEKEQTKKPSLIVAPSSLVYNWESEIHKFAPSLKTQIIQGDPATRKQLIAKSDHHDILITSYDLIRRDIESYQTQRFRYCILDEAHYIKNHTTLNAKAAKKINSEVRFALTGTPIENSLSDLWSIFDFILPGYFGTYSQFKKKYEAPVMRQENLNLLSRIHQQVAPFILRRLKKEVLKELPEKIETNMYCEMDKTQRDLYHAMVYAMKEEMNQEIQVQGIERSRIKILALLMRLRQICCDPSLYLENYQGESAKLKLCLELVDECISSGHKVLIFSQFTSMLDILSKEFKAKQIEHLILTGSTKSSDRLKLTEQFNADQTPVFLISLKAGGTGLNLTGADVVIHYDPWWNMSVQNQATDRAHRLGQEKTVQVFKLFVKNTIEEKIERLQQRKRDLTEAIVQEGETFINQLSSEELTALFESDDDF